MAGTDGTANAQEAPDGPVIILVKPQLGQNIGMVARAMLNAGLQELRMVAPRDGWPNEQAVAASSGATVILENARIFETTEQAISDLQRVYATTARPRGMVGRVVTPREAGLEYAEHRNENRAVGVLFGNERAGLDNEDVVLADTIIEAPLNPNFMSLNLAQAVLLVAYEWRMGWLDAPVERMETGRSDAVSKEELINFFNRLEDSLESGGFFRAVDMRPVMVRNLRNIFQRANLTDQEVRTLHGAIEALKRLRSPNLNVE